MELLILTIRAGGAVSMVRCTLSELPDDLFTLEPRCER